MAKMRVQGSRIIIGPPGEVTINFDNHITEVSMRDEGGLHTWTASGQTFQTNCEDGSKYTFNVTLADGYILDQATGLGGDFGVISTVVRETSFTVTGGLAGVSGTITLTSKATASVPTPDWANCFVKTSAGNKAVEKVWIKQNGQLVTVYEAQEPEPQVIGPYLTFKSETPFTLNAIAPTMGSKWDGILEYSTDTITWTEWNKELISSGKFNTLYLRGENNTTMGRPFELTGDEISAYGNIENLLDYKIVASGGHPTMKVNAFEKLFGGSNLVRPPSLGFITVANYACMRMFRGCTKLKVLPLIHATSIGQTSLAYMFDGCTNIKLSTTQTEEYKYEWRIPQQGTASSLGNYWNNKTFINTGGTFTGSPSANTTYYTTEEPV